jgi:hypothetical protein
MTITRNEFKELVYLYAETWNTYVDACNTLNEEWAGELIFPVIDWIEKKLHIDDDAIGNALLYELAKGSGGFLVDYELNEDGEICNEKFSRDLDEIYDYYIDEARQLRWQENSNEE